MIDHREFSRLGLSVYSLFSLHFGHGIANMALLHPNSDSILDAPNVQGVLLQVFIQRIMPATFQVLHAYVLHIRLAELLGGKWIRHNTETTVQVNLF